MVSSWLSRIILLAVGILYPAYASHKAVKTKNVKEYVRWMIYWIVFAFYMFFEIFTDIFVAIWLPFYYELKIVFILWLTSPATKGSSFLYKKFINPHLNHYEQMIDSYIESFWNSGYDLMRNISVQATDFVFETLLDMLQKGQVKFATLFPHINIAQQNAVIENPLDPAQSHDILDVQDKSGGENTSSSKQFKAKKSESDEWINSLEDQDSSDSDSLFEDLSSCDTNHPIVVEKEKNSRDKISRRRKVEKRR